MLTQVPPILCVSASECEQARHEVVVQEASDNATAGRLLLDACKDHVSQRKGVGMVVRTLGDGPGGNITSRNVQSKDFFVKQLVAGGSAAKCGQIQHNDVLVAVEGTKVQGMTIEQVQDLILGPEGTTVALALLKPSPTGGVRYSQTLVRGEMTQTRPFADEAKEGVDAVNNVHAESRALKARVEELAAVLAEGVCVFVYLRGHRNLIRTKTSALHAGVMTFV